MSYPNFSSVGNTKFTRFNASAAKSNVFLLIMQAHLSTGSWKLATGNWKRATGTQRQVVWHHLCELSPDWPIKATHCHMSLTGLSNLRAQRLRLELSSPLCQPATMVRSVKSFWQTSRRRYGRTGPSGYPQLPLPLPLEH